MPGMIVAALVLAIVGAIALYAGARHQQLMSSPLPALRWLGGGALLVSLVLMLRWFGLATGIFAWVTLAMLVWSIVPLAAAWWRRPREEIK